MPRLGGERGPYALQAGIAACHARAPAATATDWVTIATLHETLARVTGTPVVELNRAAAVSMANGAAVDREVVERLVSHPQFERYHLLPEGRPILATPAVPSQLPRLEPPIVPARR